MKKLSLKFKPVYEKREVRHLRLCYKFKELIKPVKKYKAIRFLKNEFFKEYVNKYDVKQKGSKNGFWYYFSQEFCYFYNCDDRNDILCLRVNDRKIDCILDALDKKIAELKDEIYTRNKEKYYFDSCLYNAVSDIFSSGEYDLEKFEEVRAKIIDSLMNLSAEVVNLNFSEMLLKNEN